MGSVIDCWSKMVDIVDMEEVDMVEVARVEADKETFMAQLENNSRKRKSLIVEEKARSRASKVFRDASQFFDDDSNAEAEPTTEEVVVEKEVLNCGKVTVKQEISEQIALNVEEVRTQLVQELLRETDDVENNDKPVATVEELLVDSDDDFRIEQLGVAITDQAEKNVDNLQKVIEYTLDQKDKEIKALMKDAKEFKIRSSGLEKENAMLKEQFKNNVKVKQEVLEDGIEKTKNEYDNRLKNIDEEREYLLEEIKLKDDELKIKEDELLKKDNELKQKNEEIKQANVNLERKVSQLQRMLGEKGKNLQRSEEKTVSLQSRLERHLKKKPPQTDIEKKLVDLENENDKLKDEKLETEKKFTDKENEMAKLESSALAKLLESETLSEKNALAEKDMEEQKKTFQKELLDMHTIVKQMRNEKTSNEKLIKTKDTKLRELSNEVNTKKNKLKTFKTTVEALEKKLTTIEESSKITEEYKLDLESKIAETDDLLQNKDSLLNSFETENKILREESSRKLNEMENILKDKNRELEDVIMQDLDIIEKDREEISNLTSKIESMENEKRMDISESEEKLLKKTDELEKTKSKCEMVRKRLLEVANLKMEMETKVNDLENTNFMLDMKVKESEEKEVQNKTELTEFTNKVFLLEMKVLEKED